MYCTSANELTDGTSYFQRAGFNEPFIIQVVTK